jgi:hypothetical protein
MGSGDHRATPSWFDRLTMRATGNAGSTERNEDLIPGSSPGQALSLSKDEVRAHRIIPLVAISLWLGLLTPVSAAVIANPIAAFSGLDKITGRLTKFDVYMDETVQFGALQITPRACYTRPPDEVQRTSVFVEVDQVSLQQTVRRIFTGWMFADSPALNAVDHAVYDIWLVECKTTSDTPPPPGREPAAAAEQPPQ